MDLWIRSQDKTILIKVNSILIDDEQNSIYTNEQIGSSQLTYTLGTYKSKERALEVLDDINDLLNTDINMNTDYQHADIIIKSCIASNMYKCYQMPEE